MLAYFGTDVDWGKGAIGVDVDGVEGIGVEQGDEEWCLSLLKINLPGNSVEEVGVDELFPGVPDVSALFVDNRVLVRVVVVGSEARQGSKEGGKGKEVGCKWSKEGGWRRQGRGGDSGDRSFDDGQQDVFNWDILMVDGFTRELKLHPIVLIERG